MIEFFEQTKTFMLNTNKTTYAICIADGFVGHAYYGKKICNDDISYLLRTNESPFVPSKNKREMHSFLDCFAQEMPTEGLGDFRESALAICNAKGHNGVRLTYKEHRIYDGYAKLDGLPHLFGDDKFCKTLEIITVDNVLGVEVTLLYTVFASCNIIARSMIITNKGTKEECLYIKKALSASFDMDNNSYDIITLHGSWARERHIERRPLHKGLQSVASCRGETSHQEHPFIALLDKSATQNSGCVYGMNFIYSGNFVAGAQVNQFDSVRLFMGINAQNFCWKLQKGESFTCPQVVLTYSDEGLNGMTHNFHDAYRNHLIRSSYKDLPRPILINNWEATYFNFNTQKLIDIAKEASKDGIEMLVMDDGWFGRRNSDNCSLGDWTVNEEKITGGLNYLVSEVKKLGLKFGIWFEPEMISPDSDLYRAHPTWAIQIPGREAGQSREQYVLDLTQKEVANYAYNSVAKILQSAPIDYVKWDMNRQLSDIGSNLLQSDEMGEFFHKYVLAVYNMQERLISDFPNLLLENCSGGGARFDPGMLFYSPQIWCSDDTDAIERLNIQEGTSLVYPLSCIGAHVSTCPNHACGRVTPFKTRGYVALAGTFGYELDITKLNDEERSQIPEQVALYKKYNELVRKGDYYRVASYRENNEYDSWIIVSKDKKQALLTFVQVLHHPNYKSRMIKLCGLDSNALYRVTFVNENKNDYPDVTLHGDTLMHCGLQIKRPWADFGSILIELNKV